jgi:hypothetical protein
MDWEGRRRRREERGQGRGKRWRDGMKISLRKIKRASSNDDQESLDRTSYFEGKKLYISQGIEWGIHVGYAR